MKLRIAIAALFLLPGCTEVVNTSGRYAQGKQREAYMSADKLEELFTYHEPPPPSGPPPVPPAYCYKVMQDIVCYDRPIPNAQRRLVGWQGTGPKGDTPAVVVEVKKVEEVRREEEPKPTPPPPAPKPFVKPVPKQVIKKPVEPAQEKDAE